MAKSSFVKLGSAALSVADLAADVINGTREYGSKISLAGKNEIDTLSEERRIENAVDRILVKAKGIKQIQKALGCTLQEAEELLNQELNASLTKEKKEKKDE